jgi:C-5 cytosine-specific DNA methylase
VNFFAGGGLVSQGAKHALTIVRLNNIWPKKAANHTANHGDCHFHLGSIENITSSSIPQGDIVWASFPCYDLSLTGKIGGLAASRSGLFWKWQTDFRLLCQALRDRSYKIGPASSSSPTTITSKPTPSKTTAPLGSNLTAGQDFRLYFVRLTPPRAWAKAVG